MWDTAAIAELDGAAACVALDRARSVLVAAEVAEFFLAAHWADLHPGEAVEEERRARRRRGGRNPRGSERGRQLGADGTPLVAEFAPMELGVHLGMGYVAAATLLRDALNVRHRHPALWAALGRVLPAPAPSDTADPSGNSDGGSGGSDGSSGTATTDSAAAGPDASSSADNGRVGMAGCLPRVWQARMVARMCADAGLDADRARWVDEVTTPYLGVLPWGRFRALVAARIIEADPEEAEARRQAAAAARFVRTGQSTEHGLKTLIVRANAGDVILFVAMVDRIAQILYLRGDHSAADILRSKAVGILATPARALRMLEETEAMITTPARPATGIPDPSTDGPGAGPGGGSDCGSDESSAGPTGDTSGDGTVGEDPETIGEADVPPADNDADDAKEAPAPVRRPCPACAGTGSVTGDPAPFTRPTVDPRRLLPEATLYFHLAEESLRTGTGVARFEGVGPLTLPQLCEFLGHTNVRVVPVADLAGQRPVDGYEVPARMREATHLRSPACISPWGTNLSRRKDMEHIKPYTPPARGGPPGQTSMDNLGPLSRHPHRVKTHGRWTLTQTGPGAYEWRTPHGYRFAVDHHGTHPLGKTDPEPARAPQHTSAPPATPETTRSAHHQTRESAHETRLAELVDRTPPPPSARSEAV